MSSGNWGKRFATFITGRPESSTKPISFWDISRLITSLGLHAISIYLLVGVGLVVWSVYQSNRDAYRQAKDNDERSQHQASRHIASECAVPGAPVDIIAECLAAEVGAYQKRQNTDKDLQAQQDMAYWAFMMFIASVASVIVSVGALVMLLRSLRQTEKAISTDRDVGHAQVRAYIAISPEGPMALPGQVPTATIKFKNSGQSPAYRFREIAALMICEHPLADHQKRLIEFAADERIPSQTIQAGAEIRDEATDIGIMTREDFEIIRDNGARRLYCTALAAYDDVFGVPHETNLCAYSIVKKLSEPGPKGGPLYILEWELAHFLNEAT